MMSSGLTFGTISAVVPTAIAERWFLPAQSVRPSSVPQ